MKIINILGLAIVMLLSLTACGSKGILVETMEEEGTEAVFGEISANASDSDAADTEDVVASEDTITVYVCGAVVQEGVYELPAGSRISDALLMAGGYDENALHGYVNLRRVGNRSYKFNREFGEWTCKYQHGRCRDA